MINNYLNQQKYYFLGLFIGLASRLKKFVLGLKSPRPRMLALSDYQINLTYDQDILKTIFGLNNKPDFFINKKVLEVGPGPDLMLGLLTLENGASSYQAIDYFPVLSAPPFFYKKISETLTNPVAIKAAQELSSSLPNSQEINVSNLSYKILGIEKLGSLQEKYDIIFSKDVLEHIDDLDSAFKAMKQSLTPNGYMIHKVDFQTHTSFIQETDRLNFLRYSENIYKKFVKFRGGPNRLRLPELIELAKASGFTIEKIYINKEMSESELAKIKPYLSQYYRNLPDSALSPLSAWIIFH